MRPRLTAPAVAMLLLGSTASVAWAQGDADIDIRLADVCSRTVTGMQRVTALKVRGGPPAELAQLELFYRALGAYCGLHGIDLDPDDVEDDG